MKNIKEKMIIGNIMAILAFVFAAALIFIAVGTSTGAFIATKVNLAVHYGAPIFEYKDEGSQPTEGIISMDEIMIPSIGSRYGNILCDSIDLKAPLYYGDDDSILSKGAGQYTGSGLPGESRPILVGAHDLGYFAPLEYIKKDDIIEINTSYGNFSYEVTQIKIMTASSYGRDQLETDNEELILYTCYPFGSFTSNTEDRYFVIAQKLSGPVLKET